MVYSFDPGIVAMGACIWEPEKRKMPFSNAKLAIPVAACVIRPCITAPTWVEKVRDMLLQLDVIAKEDYGEPTVVVCETMIFFQSDVGHASAARGDVFKVAAMTGALAAWGFKYGAKFIPAPVNEWKGQLPKDAVNRRIRKLLPDDFIRNHLTPKESHDWDAAGVGLWWFGEFN